MNLLNLLLGSMTNQNTVNALSGKTGIGADQLLKLVKAALPILLKFLTNNASSAGGAASLLGALTQHTSQKSMALQIEEADVDDGNKIIGHILGGDAASVISNLAGQSGLSGDQVSQALGSMAPALMSGLSAATTSASKVDLSDGLDLSDLMGLFGGTPAPAAAAPASSGGILEKITSLFTGKKAEPKKEEDPFDGTALLGTLAGLMKQ